MNQFYSMSETVYEALSVCADAEYYTFALLEPKIDDPPERKKELEKEQQEINDLIKLDILNDVSYKFISQIKECKDEHGFGYKVVELTEAGILMFRNIKDRKVN